jgi:hypothetical protein
MEWTGDNLRDIIAFTGRHPSAADWTWEHFEEVVKRDGLIIFTLEGKHLATVGDFIIKGVKGECYPCKPDIFALTYEPAALASSPSDGEPEMHPALLAANEADAQPVESVEAARQVARDYLRLCEWKPGRYEVYQTRGGRSHRLSDAIRVLLVHPPRSAPARTPETTDAEQVKRVAHAITDGAEGLPPQDYRLLAECYLAAVDGNRPLAEEVARRAMVEQDLRKEIETLRAAPAERETGAWPCPTCLNLMVPGGTCGECGYIGDKVRAATLMADLQEKRRVRAATPGERGNG